MLVDLQDNFIGSGGRRVNLRDVTYTTTSVDNGTKFTNIPCTTTAAVSPTSQTWSDVDDPGDWSGRCGFNCSADNGGAVVTIAYQ